MCFHWFLERKGVGGRERERERERNIDWLSPICTPTRDWTHNLGMCPDWESNPQPLSAQDSDPTNWAV